MLSERQESNQSAGNGEHCRQPPDRAITRRLGAQRQATGHQAERRVGFHGDCAAGAFEDLDIQCPARQGERPDGYGERASRRRHPVQRRHGSVRKQISHRLIAIAVLVAKRRLLELADRGPRNLLRELDGIGQPPLREAGREKGPELVGGRVSAPLSARRPRAGARPTSDAAPRSTAASATAGCPISAVSSATELIHSPPDLTRSFARSVELDAAALGRSSRCRRSGTSRPR